MSFNVFPVYHLISNLENFLNFLKKKGVYVESELFDEAIPSNYNVLLHRLKGSKNETIDLKNYYEIHNIKYEDISDLLRGLINENTKFLILPNHVLLRALDVNP